MLIAFIVSHTSLYAVQSIVVAIIGYVLGTWWCLGTQWYNGNHGNNATMVCKGTSV